MPGAIRWIIARGRNFQTSRNMPSVRSEVTKDGPYLVSGGPPLSEQWIVTNAGGDSLDYREGKKFPDQSQYALCQIGSHQGRPLSRQRRTAFERTMDCHQCRGRFAGLSRGEEISRPVAICPLSDRKSPRTALISSAADRL